MKKKLPNRTPFLLFIASIFLFTACGEEEMNRKNTSIEINEERIVSDATPSVSYTVFTDTSFLDHSYDISDTLYGIFLEDINFSVDGGLYAEMIKNRSFEYGAIAGNQHKHGWVASDPSDSNFSFTITDGSMDGTSLNDNNTYYALLENTSAKQLGISNKGFLEGIVLKEENYIFSTYFKSTTDYDGPVHISLRDTEGFVYASGVIDGITRDWHKYSLTLTPSNISSTQEVRLYVEIDHGSICADMVSLLPEETYMGTSIRKDIGEYLEALHPSFFRFPGGCMIEGRDEESIYNWKDSLGNGLEFSINGELKVGDVASRPQGKSIWNGNTGHPYYTTYGIGFYEYFELCEIFDCQPLPVLNAGMTCPVQSPKYIVYDLDSEAFAETLQDALDLVEFCRGDDRTYWGSVRSAMGHPEPFSLTYIGIGNEQWQTEYFQHYQKFVEAFAAAALDNPTLYGGIELVLANGPTSGDQYGWNFLENHPDTITTMIDEHYYESPSWFLTNTTRYDDYDRDTQAQVFLGEYAAQSNTLEAALAEAAYMTGLERNSDIVKMACYAPLFGNATSNQWQPDLIWYSQSSLYGSPNYYVQKMFSNNLGNQILPSQLATENLSHETSLSGKAGLATWQTSAAFDNLVVTSNDTGDVLYECTFDEDTILTEDGWMENEGDWSVTEGRLVQSYSGDPFDTNTGDSIYFGDTSWSNYTLSVDAEILEGKEGFLLPVCVEDTANHIFWNLGGWGNTISCLQSVSGNAKSGQLSGTIRNASLKQQEVYHLKVVVSGNQIQCFVNDIKYVDYTYPKTEVLYETASVDKNGDIYIKIVNVSDLPIEINTTLADLDLTLYHTDAEVTVLQGESLSDTNSFTEPEKLFPKSTSIPVEKSFTYTAPKYSVSILSIRVK